MIEPLRAAFMSARTACAAKNIDSIEVHPGTGSRFDLALASLLILLGCAVFFYLSHALVAAV